MTTAADVVAEALEWLGTPFHWQASLKGVGADCKGLPAGICNCLGMPEGQSIYAAMSDYGRRVPVETLKRGLAEIMHRVDDPQPGDLLLMNFGGRAQHLGIHGGDVLIHTYNAGPRKVIATPLAVALRAWPLDSAWRFPSLEG